MKEQRKQTCQCNVCGRRRNVIEEELEMLYDAYYEELKVSEEKRSLGISSPNLNKNAINTNHTNTNANTPRNPEMVGEESFCFSKSLTVKEGILTVADDLLKNDGRKFLDMMELFAESRQKKDDEYDEDYEDDEDYEEDSEEELSEEQRMEEGRRMFQVFAAKMFEQRVLSAYKEDLAYQKQEQLIQEEEQEKSQKNLKEKNKQMKLQKKKERKKIMKLQQEEHQRVKDDEEKIQEELEKIREMEQQKKEEARRREEERIHKLLEAQRLKDIEDSRRNEKEKILALERERERERRKYSEIRNRDDKPTSLPRPHPNPAHHANNSVPLGSAFEKHHPHRLETDSSAENFEHSNPSSSQTVLPVATSALENSSTPDFVEADSHPVSDEFHSFQRFEALPDTMSNYHPKVRFHPIPHHHHTPSTVDDSILPRSNPSFPPLPVSSSSPSSYQAPSSSQLMSGPTNNYHSQQPPNSEFSFEAHHAGQNSFHNPASCPPTYDGSAISARFSSVSPPTHPTNPATNQLYYGNSASLSLPSSLAMKSLNDSSSMILPRQDSFLDSICPVISPYSAPFQPTESPSSFSNSAPVGRPTEHDLSENALSDLMRKRMQLQAQSTSHSLNESGLTQSCPPSTPPSPPPFPISSQQHSFPRMNTNFPPFFQHHSHMDHSVPHQSLPAQNFRAIRRPDPIQRPSSVEPQAKLDSTDAHLGFPELVKKLPQESYSLFTNSLFGMDSLSATMDPSSQVASFRSSPLEISDPVLQLGSADSHTWKPNLTPSFSPVVESSWQNNPPKEIYYNPSSEIEPSQKLTESLRNLVQSLTSSQQQYASFPELVDIFNASRTVPVDSDTLFDVICISEDFILKPPDGGPPMVALRS
eukprot:Sdes_comp20941_c1_seq1m18470